tara:strand:+ start:276 stop:626 length:351 start_codon:yes stop_codon:yes gene_type:complete
MLPLNKLPDKIHDVTFCKEPIDVGSEPLKLFVYSSKFVKSVKKPNVAGRTPVIEALFKFNDMTDVPSQVTPVQVTPEHNPVATKLPPDPVQLQPVHPKAAFRVAIFVDAIRSHKTT